MDGNFGFDLNKLIMEIMNQYGASGFAMMLCVYLLRVFSVKMDKIIELQNKLYGAMDAYAKQKQSKRGGCDD